MSKKIAISTIINVSMKNYGAVLQAYALNKKLRQFGYVAEHLDFSLSNFPLYKYPTSQNTANAKSSFIRRCIQKFLVRPWNHFKIALHKKEIKEVKDAIEARKQAFNHFEYRLTPHSSTIYTPENIKDSLTEYDIFVCGSDQIWNPQWLNMMFLLDFVPSTIPKFSYAASVSAKKLAPEQQNTFKDSLSGYIGVSVRERDTVDLLRPLAPIEPVYSLDPTLLLTKEEWDDAAAERVVDENYIFCYFLDEGEKLRKLAKEYAEKHNYKIVAIPFLMNKYNRYDKKYSDILFADATPEMFISLVKHASLIMTDSFHASVFSLIYQKEYFAFRRAGHGGMDVRLETLTDMFGTQERFCNTDERESISYLEGCNPIDYSKQEKYLDMKQVSIAYLQEMLEKSERMLNKS